MQKLFGNPSKRKKTLLIVSGLLITVGWAVDFIGESPRLFNALMLLATLAALMIGVFSGSVHMAGGMLIHELSVILVILNGVRLKWAWSGIPGGDRRYHSEAFVQVDAQCLFHKLTRARFKRLPI